MSQEFENQIKESVFNDKIIFFWKKNKSIIIIIGIFILTAFISYYSYEILNKKKYSQELQEYSIAIEKLKNQDVHEAKKIFIKLINSGNNNLVLLSLNQLLISSKNSKEEMIAYINSVLKKNNLTKKNIELLNIKKAIIVFDTENEKNMREFIDKKNNFFFDEMKKSLLNDFLISKNKINKTE